GGGAGARRADRGIGGDRRRRQCRGLPAAASAPFQQRQSGRRGRLGNADPDVLGRHQERGIFLRHDHGGSPQCHRNIYQRGNLFANITPNNHMTSYLTDEEKLAGVYITEKVDRKTGWQFICLEEEWTRGYLQEIQDFMECVVLGRQPRADLGLAYETTKINYAGYWSAEEGRRIAL